MLKGERAKVGMRLDVHAAEYDEETEIARVVKPSAEIAAGVMLTNRRNGKHPAYKWMKDSRSEHLAHAYAHLKALLEASEDRDFSEEDFTHFVCRAMMAAATVNQT